MAPHSSTLAWKIPWMDEPGRLQSMGSLRVRHDSVTSLSLFTFMHWRRLWHPTPVFLPGESQGRGSLVGCCLWGRTESDTTEATQQQQQQYDITNLSFNKQCWNWTPTCRKKKRKKERKKESRHRIHYELKMDHRPRGKMQSYKTPGRQPRRKIYISMDMVITFQMKYQRCYF